jgi:BCD family chlorophyll transporter-like MFS transporter
MTDAAIKHMPAATAPAPIGGLGWLGILRLGLVQTALGAIVIMTTSTLNRVMVVELALPATIPGVLVAWHYALQMLRPRWGYGSDQGRRRTPWIIGGMATLAVGGALAAFATALTGVDAWAGLALAVAAFSLIGIGVGAAGTSLLVLLAEKVAAPRRTAAATTVWLMMIAGFAVTAVTVGRFLDPYSPERLVAVAAVVSALAFAVSVLAISGVEGRGGPVPSSGQATEGLAAPKPTFRAALADVWSEPLARLFTLFIFLSMLAYSSQDLILEPFAALAFGLTPGQTTQLSGTQHGGVLAGMILAAVSSSLFKGRGLGAGPLWTIGGCLASALVLAVIALSPTAGFPWSFSVTVFALGLANGAYAGAAIGAMMHLCSRGTEGRQGTRMGLWGAAQAIAFAVGGMAGAIAVDLTRLVIPQASAAYAAVFLAESGLFVLAAVIALRVARMMAATCRETPPAAAGGYEPLGLAFTMERGTP